MKEITVPAKDSLLDEVSNFVETELRENGCPPRTTMQILIALEELFVNIAHYGYPGGEGTATVAVGFDGECAILRLTDSGIPFNPLKREDPDVSLPAEERKIGGLGIYMVRKTMDEMQYEYTDGKNILSIKKTF